MEIKRKSLEAAVSLCDNPALLAVLFVTLGVYSFQDSNNDYIRKIAAEHKNVTVIDWHDLVSKHPEWLSGDGVHPNDAGTEQYARLVHDALAEALTK